jgi:nucleotide-binding universal stress UspA family protein
MSMKDILVHVEDGNRDGARIQAAVDVARAFQAQLAGIHVVVHQFGALEVRADIAVELHKAQATAIREDAEKAEQLFRDKVGSSGLATEWHSENGEVIDVVTHHGRYADLVVTGQDDPDSTSYGGRDMPDRLVLAVGRPVLIIPRNGSFENVGSRIMVAWDAGRASARAVHDAMPFLERAEDIKVVSANVAVEGREGPAATLCRQLERHGIKAEPRDIIEKGKRKRDALLGTAEEEGANLIVMGAYGHPRWRELVLGGITQHMLSHGTIPMLMSH